VSQTEFILWVVFGISVLALIALQVRSMLAAARLGGRSSRTVIALRSAIVMALLGLFGYVLWVQAAR
jgi:hypothetical protein